MENRKLFIKNLVIVLVVVGVIGAIGSITEKNKKSETANEGIEEGKNYFEYSYFMSGAKKVLNYNPLKGGDLSCVMGGGEIDLTGSTLNGPARIDVFCLMGGAQFTIPSDWTVQNDAVAVMGGIHDENDDKGLETDPNKVLILDGSAVMGGIEIKRR